MSPAVWKRFKEEAVKLRESDEELKAAARCNWGDNVHHNQIAYYDCPECCPFHDLYETVIEPPAYYAALNSKPRIEGEGDGSQSLLALVDIFEEATVMINTAEPSTAPIPIDVEEEEEDVVLVAVSSSTPNAPPHSPDVAAPAKKLKRSRLEMSCKWHVDITSAMENYAVWRL